MDYTIITDIVVAILASLAVIFGQPYQNILNYRRRRKLKSLLNTNDVKEIIERCGKEFEEGFIIPEIKESYFYAKTGIKTNHLTIQKYIDLKNELGLNWDWKSIRFAKRFIRVNKNQAYISIEKFEKVFFTIVLTVSILLIFGSIVTLTVLDYLDWFRQLKKVDRIAITVFGCLMVVVGAILLGSNFSYLQAIHLQKRLKKLRGTKVSESTIEEEK